MEQKDIATLVDAVTGPETDFRAIVVELSKTHPELIVQSTISLYDRIHVVAEAEGKIPAIKMFRQIMGCRLREAKHAVEIMFFYDEYTIIPTKDK